MQWDILLMGYRCVDDATAENNYDCTVNVLHVLYLTCLIFGRKLFSKNSKG